jgi:plasmid stabilization system protein ParE
MRIKILASAIEDLDAGRIFYARQGEGLGEYFFDSIFSEIDSLLLCAGIHARHFGYYRLLAKRFPYAIYYAKELDIVVIYRILDMRRNPEISRHALEGGIDPS